jgi:hypothetical protein
MTHRRRPAPDERTPEWLIGLLIAIVLVTVGWFFLRSIGAGDDPVLGDERQGDASQTHHTEFVLHEGAPAVFASGIPLVVSV